MKEYYLGLDIGTNSIGWAVTDEQYNVPKFNGRRMWGIRLFDEAHTAAERRAGRCSRRRLARRKARIDLLQELFAEEMAKVDPTFFIRLNESRLLVEDKTTDYKYPLFTDDDYNDKDFYNQFPTIYHLRKELMSGKEPHDIRQVYLACHHILKNRGHFLVEGTIENVENFEEICRQMCESFNDVSDYEITVTDVSKLQTILKDRNKAKSKKADEMKLLFECSAQNGLDEVDKKKKKNIIDNICRLIAGNKGELKKIFDENFDGIDDKIQFSDSTFDETKFPDIEANYPDYAAVIGKLKLMYDWGILEEILRGKSSVSAAKVSAYEEHQENLAALKNILRKYLSKKEYRTFFNAEQGDNYSNYIGTATKNGQKIAVKKCKDEDFYKGLSKILSGISAEKEDEEIICTLKNGCQNENLLPKLRNRENGVIPNQLHVKELKQILENAKTYMPFLNEADEKGITVADKIVKIAEFRIPYYVGPLSRKYGKNAWIERKREGRIYPWNFDEMVDEEASNEAFITRMTNKCTYLIGEDVLPKHSLLYSKFMVLNELNNLKVRNQKISVELKQKLYKSLFCERAKVTGKRLLEELKKEDNELKAEDLSGFDIDFKASLTSYLDFKKKIFGEEIEKDTVKKAVEEIIKYKTIYGQDNKMMKKTLVKAYADCLTDEQISQICRFNYQGWGRLSEKMLTGIVGADKETGECFTIIEALWKTNNNLMELLSQRFSFTEQIDEINAEKSGDIGKITYENVVEDLYVSPAIKRAVWQTILITEEIRKIMKTPPKRIFVEMARGGEKEKKRTVTRKQKLIDLYSACEEDMRSWTEEIGAKEDRDFNSRKIYLYYLQKGRCMYSGEAIDIDKLTQKNSDWDIDHIFPQSKIKDDSFDNMVLVKKSINMQKKNEKIPENIRAKMNPFWRSLKEEGFISQKKFDRLMKSELKPEEMAGFVERQLVETRQSAKAVKDLLAKLYGENTNVVCVKAGLVSDFRNEKKMLKSRRVNDYHHAKDAYLNIVVGNVYDAKFTSNVRQWVKNNYNNYTLNVFACDVNRGHDVVWKHGENGSITTVKKHMSRNDILHTEYTYCEKGELFNMTLYRKQEGTLKIKKDLDTAKYGGYKSAKTGAFALIEFDEKKNKRLKNITEVPVYVINLLKTDEKALLDYFESKDVYHGKNVRILKYPIKKNSLIISDGYPMRITGVSGINLLLKNNVQLVLSQENYNTVKAIERFISRNSEYEVNEKIDKLEESEMIDLYRILKDKLHNSIYSKRPANQYKVLADNEDRFIELTLNEKTRILYEIITFFRCDAQSSANLKLLGAGGTVGGIKVNKNTLGKSGLVLVNQSVTGLFETREVLN